MSITPNTTTDWLDESVRAVCEGLKRWPQWVETRCEVCDENGIDAGLVCENCGGSTKVHVPDPRVEAALALVQRECPCEYRLDGDECWPCFRRGQHIHDADYSREGLRATWRGCNCRGNDVLPRDLRREMCHYSYRATGVYLVIHAQMVAKALGLVIETQEDGKGWDARIIASTVLFRDTPKQSIIWGNGDSEAEAAWRALRAAVEAGAA